MCTKTKAESSNQKGIGSSSKSLNSKNNYIFKIVILGDSGVGKTTLMQRFLSKKHSSTPFRPTIGCDFHNYKTKINDSNATLQIWDTAGQERFQSLGKAFYRGTDA